MTQNVKKNFLIYLILLLVIGVLVLISNMYIKKQIIEDEKYGLMVRVGTVAKLIDPKEVESLKGSEEDLKSPTYINLKKKLTEAQKFNTDTKFFYIMGLKDGKQFFYVDSEDPSSKDYSYPGQEYKEADALDLANHKNGTSYTKGPYKDSWGNWFSAYAPITDDQKNVVGMVGIDSSVEKVLLKIKIAKEAVAMIGLLLYLSIILVAIFARKTILKNYATNQ